MAMLGVDGEGIEDGGAGELIEGTRAGGAEPAVEERGGG